MLLADHGADVVKVEPPGGDPFRGTAGYDVWLRGRRSVALNLKETADRDRFLTLVDDADVVLEAFAPGTMARLGLDCRTLLARNPRLVVCSITAYGPHAGHPRPAGLRRARRGPARDPGRPAQPRRRRRPLHARRGAVPA